MYALRDEVDQSSASTASTAFSGMPLQTLRWGGDRKNGDRSLGKPRSLQATDQPNAKGGQRQENSADGDGDRKASLTDHGAKTSAQAHDPDATKADPNWFTPLLPVLQRQSACPTSR
jgi:hypothetical protein